MTKPLLSTAANGHNFLTFEDYDTPQWHLAIEWLKREGFSESGPLVVGLDEGILPSFARGPVVIAAGFDYWSGHYLLSQCEMGDLVIVGVANHVSANDRRATA